MTIKYTITLTDAENKALGIIANSQQEWIDNVVHERCRIAIEEIVIQEVERITSIGGTMSGTKEDIVLAATIESAAEKNAKIDLELH